MPSVPRTRPLKDCPQLPSVHTLPGPVVAHIDAASWRLAGTGRTARTQDIVGMLIMVSAPATPAALIRLLVTPHPDLRGTVAALPAGRRGGLLRPNEQHLWMRLPSPVTHRLNLLIELVHGRNFRTTRRQLVSALVLHRLPSNQTALVRAFDRYLRQTAGDARVPGQPLRVVLDATTPKPGRRPMS